MRATLARGVPTLIAFVVALGWFVAARLTRHPRWEPSGSDWDQWYMSVAALGSDAPYPAPRWPLNAWLVYGLDGVLPAPLHVNAALASLILGALAAAGVARLAVRVLPFPAAIAAFVLVVGHPLVAKLVGGIGPYPLWAAASVWTVVALVEAVGTGRIAWWGVCGAAWTAVLASIEKGLGAGLVLAGLIGGIAAVGLVATPAGRRGAWRHLLAFSLPFLGVALVYAAFPVNLTSLDEMIEMAAPRAGPVAARGGLSGWVFGQRMDPATIVETLTLARSQAGPVAAIGVKPLDELPVPDRILEGAFAVGMLAAAIAALRPTARPAERVAWAGLAAVLAATFPALTTAVPQTRFLLPGLLVAPVVLLAPFALLPRVLAPVALLAVPLALAPSTPWARSFWVAPAPSAVGGTDNDSVYVDVYERVADLDPGVAIDLAAPRDGGLLLLERGGSVLPRPDLVGARLRADRGLLVVLETPAIPAVGSSALALPVAPGAPAFGDRKVGAVWPRGGRRVMLYLGPAAPPATGG